MKISLNWIKQYTDINLGIDELAEKIGAQIGAIEEVIDLGAKYRGAVVVKVASCVDHPNADRLHLCLIDDGGITPDVKREDSGLVQVVCGAPNVREGMLVVWLPPGSTVPSTFDSEPFVLEARELRGVTSNGMLASPKELAIGDNHDGILEIDEEARPGQSFAEVYGLDDYIIDIENKMFTHRPDCFGQLGVAREIAGILGQQFTSPDWYKDLPGTPSTVGNSSSDKLTLEVRNELPELVPRFMAAALDGVTIKPSPVWLQSLLSRVGVRPINNVVDITNYIMLLTGQPLHAYDYDKVKALSGGDGAVLAVRNPHNGEKITLLNGKVVEPRPEAIMIATDKQAIGIGGVMGGGETEIDEHTERIILEVASFDMYSIRRTSMAHGLFTDAVTRFNKGQSPLQNPYILNESLRLLAQYAGAQPAGEIIDNNQLGDRQWLHPPVTVGVGFINGRLGLELTSEEVRRLLENVEFQVAVSGNDLTVTAPFWRTDIEIREDVVEEVGRLYGYDKLPVVLPERDITPAEKGDSMELKCKIGAVLSGAGANEVLTYSFVHGNLLDKAGQDRSQAFQLSNALSPDLQYYRLSLTPSLLDKVHANVKAGFDTFALFEIGTGHNKNKIEESGLPHECRQVALVFAAAKPSKGQSTGAPYYQAKRYCEVLLEKFGLADKLIWQPLSEANFEGRVMSEQMARPFEPGRSALLLDGERVIGVVGEYRQSVRKALKLPEVCAGFELFTSHLSTTGANRYVNLSRFPAVTQDICLKVSAETSYHDLFSCVKTAVEYLKPEQTYYDLSPLDIYQRDSDKQHKQVTLRLNIVSYQKTMRDSEVAGLLDEVARIAEDKLDAQRV